jgi:hypothetical protein
MSTTNAIKRRISPSKRYFLINRLTSEVVNADSRSFEFLLLPVLAADSRFQPGQISPIVSIMNP